MSPAAERLRVTDLAEVIEAYYAKGWTDGLPIVPPTEGSLRAMLDAAALKPGQEIAFIQQRQVPITAEKAAINAVMAGCRPEYMPVIVSALEAMADPRFSYHGPTTSTSGAGVFILVNGPIARKLGINCGDNLFGPGWRANATIGRAIRLIMRNVMGTLPGTLDRSTLGHGGKYTFCIAENEEESPWAPVHVERGSKPDQNAVSVFAALAPQQVSNHLSNTAEGVLTTLCAAMRFSAGTGRQPQYVLVIAGEHMRVIARDGYSKDDIRRFCFEHAQISAADLKRINLRAGEIAPEDETMKQPLVPAPQDFIVVAAGGRAGGLSAFIPGWGSKKNTEMVTRGIRQP